MNNQPKSLEGSTCSTSIASGATRMPYKNNGLWKGVTTEKENYRKNDASE